MRLNLCFLFLLFINPFSYSAETHTLPVLKVYFKGEIRKDMDYSNGSMLLTDTDGRVVKMPAKFKTRGATASQYMSKPSLNMKLRNEDYTQEADSSLLGMRSCSSWILDAMAIDRICMRNRVAFDIWNEFSRLPYDTKFGGRNGTEGRFLELYINDQYYGIYCLTDRINRKLLDLKKTQENEDGSVVVRGVLYKSGTQDILNQNKPAFSEDSSVCVVEWHNAWELTYPEDHGGIQAWKPLQDAILKGYKRDYVKRYFFLENLADYQILVMALCITDNWGNKNRFFSIRNITKDINASVPSEADRRRFVVTPWDLDTSLGGHYNGDCYDGNYTFFPLTTIFNNAPYPYGPILSDEEYMAILKQRWVEGRQGAFSPSSIHQKLEHYRDLFILSGAWKRMTNHYEGKKSSHRPKYVLDLNHEIDCIEKWYEGRFLELDEFFGITDGVDGIGTLYNSQKPTVKDQSPFFNLNGQKKHKGGKKGILVTQGKKYLLK